MDNSTRLYRLQQWSKDIQNRAESGLTVSEWCRQNNVTRYQYYYRQRILRRMAAAQLRLSEAPSEEEKPDFVQVGTDICSRGFSSGQPDIQPDIEDVPSIKNTATACIRIHDADILVAECTSEDLIRRILKAVQSC